MLVGEQPGDQEDRAGEPFVGPAGGVLDRALEAAGIDRGETYVTNAVKHFKWKARGPRRIHDKPSWSEQVACRPWLELELEAVSPRGIVLLGATAAQSLLGRDFRVTRSRGRLLESDLADVVARDDPPVGRAAGRRPRGGLRRARRRPRGRRGGAPLDGLTTAGWGKDRFDAEAPSRRLRRPRAHAPAAGEAASRTWTSGDGRSETPRSLERIRGLAIPPAWQDVWICPAPNGHLQAVGTDEAGRRQYLYHPAWREHRDREKFDEMLRFAEALPAARRKFGRLLGEPDLTRDRVLAFAITLLDRGLFRVGGEQYANDNGSHGLATLERRHVSLSGQYRRHVRVRGQERPVPRARGERPARSGASPPSCSRPAAAVGSSPTATAAAGIEVRSEDVNAFLKDLVGEEFSAKNFRTWHATVLAALGVAAAEPVSGDGARRRVVSETIEEVAAALGNTPAVCRASYIDPRVFDRYRAGSTIDPRLTGGAALARPPRGGGEGRCPPARGVDNCETSPGVTCLRSRSARANGPLGAPSPGMPEDAPIIRHDPKSGNDPRCGVAMSSNDPRRRLH